jgi:hypothetical protein
MIDRSVEQLVILGKKMTTIEEITSLVNESGNNFHCKVTNYLKSKHWHTLISPYYMDGSTNKAREIDIIAEKMWSYEDTFEGVYGSMHIKLFIECKYIPQPNVFWFGSKDKVAAEKWLVTNTPFTERNIFTEKHHYLAECNKVAKLFSSKNSPKEENEPIYKALNQSLNAMVNLRHRGSILPDKMIRNTRELATFELPVILCNNFEKFYRVEIDSEVTPDVIDENFQLEVNYAYIDLNKKNVNDYFLIDIVSFDKLDAFLDSLDNDIAAISEVLSS